MRHLENFYMQKKKYFKFLLVVFTACVTFHELVRNHSVEVRCNHVYTAMSFNLPPQNLTPTKLLSWP
jgi:hypothetical protein